MILFITSKQCSVQETACCNSTSMRQFFFIQQSKMLTVQSSKFLYFFNLATIYETAKKMFHKYTVKQECVVLVCLHLCTVRSRMYEFHFKGCSRSCVNTAFLRIK